MTMVKYGTLLILGAFVCISYASTSCIGYKGKEPCRGRNRLPRVERSILPCTEKLDEICGSDGVTYRNKCYYHQAASTGRIHIKHRGPCDNSVIRKPRDVRRNQSNPREPKLNCACTRELNEMCGTDGFTYSNPCLLRCAIKTFHDVELSHKGRCSDHSKVARKPRHVRNQINTEIRNPREPKLNCACTRELNEMCGTDGFTYSNPCLLRCAIKTFHDVELSHKGRCSDHSKVARKPRHVRNQINTEIRNPREPKLNCACTRELNEMCGTDGFTYSNPCLLRCAIKTFHDVELRHSGSCDNDKDRFGRPIVRKARDVQPNED
ncbi:serine protease inhibitor dipetalogastin-like [Pectinophora gossypiella]|uniref:serine protease inhibitor dipetalogastin-like n=1 Tax=Pectinophora gossypiella TaxID=13191 RepID=UPI00214E65C5|nr:serine protease inhibitor dipetalogastin-like [Pectinophora gossypiella]